MKLAYRNWTLPCFSSLLHCLAGRRNAGFFLLLPAWLKDPARNVRSLHAQLQTAENTIQDLQAQLDLKISELESRNDELQSALVSSANLAYTAIGIAIIAVAAVVVMVVRERAKKNMGMNE